MYRVREKGDSLVAMVGRIMSRGAVYRIWPHASKGLCQPGAVQRKTPNGVTGTVPIPLGVSGWIYKPSGLVPLRECIAALGREALGLVRKADWRALPVARQFRLRCG